jgi:transcription termination factor Rho
MLLILLHYIPPKSSLVLQEILKKGGSLTIIATALEEQVVERIFGILKSLKVLVNGAPLG